MTSFIRACALLGCAALVSSCAFMADMTATSKVAVTTRSESAVRADALFWKTLHDGDYDGIGQALQAMKAAYLQTPSDPETAARVGFLHIWRLAESARQETLSPNITDDAVMARKYFEEAAVMNPNEARYQGFLASALLAEGAIHRDERTTRRGYYTLLDSIRAWPEFNLFTAGYAMARQPHDSPRFEQGLQWQWRNIDECVGTTVDRKAFAFERYMHLETKTGPKRACWNSWIAPHNFEGFFLNMGDMLVKSGDWPTAQKVYAAAKLSPDYATWKYKDTLERRIEQAQANVERFRKTPQGRTPGETAMMGQSRFACTACHQR